MPTQRDSAGKWISRAPSCQTPSSVWNRGTLPWFMWMSCTPLPGRKPNVVSAVWASGPQRSPNAWSVPRPSAIARVT